MARSVLAVCRRRAHARLPDSMICFVTSGLSMRIPLSEGALNSNWLRTGTVVANWFRGVFCVYLFLLLVIVNRYWFRACSSH
jgi:hypothetical protein